jgi:hypothetical protein
MSCLRWFSTPSDKPAKSKRKRKVARATQQAEATPAFGGPQ